MLAQPVAKRILAETIAASIDENVSVARSPRDVVAVQAFAHAKSAASAGAI